MDLEKIDRATDSLNRQEQEIRARLSCEFEASLIAKLDLDDAMTVLTPKQRECVRLSLQGYTVREIAATLALTPTTIQESLTTAYRKLKKYFLESG